MPAEEGARRRGPLPHGPRTAAPALVVACLAVLPAVASAAPKWLVTPAEVQHFLGGRTGKILYADRDDGPNKMYWVDLNTMERHKVSDETRVWSALISPDGTRVVYNFSNIVSNYAPDSAKNSGQVFVRPLSGGARKLVCCANSQAFEGHWWVKPGTSEQYIVYMDYHDKEDHNLGSTPPHQPRGRATWKQKIKADGTPETKRIKVLDHAFDGGLSPDGKIVGEGFGGVYWARTLDLGGGDGKTISKDLKDPTHTTACNVSMSPDSKYWMLHAEAWHQRVLVRDPQGNVVRVIPKPDPANAIEMTWPEYSNHPHFVTFTAKFANDKNHLYLADIANANAVKVFKVAEGNFSGPHLWVAPDIPVLTLDPKQVDFTATEGGADPTAQNVTVSNGASGTLDHVTVAENAAWLTVQRSGTGNQQTLRNVIDIAGLAPGTYSTQVAVQSETAVNSPQTYSVSLQITAAPRIDLSPAALTFTAQRAGPSPELQPVAVTNTGAGTLDPVQTEHSASWLEVTRSTSGATQTLWNAVAVGGLALGTHRATVTVRSASALKTATYTVELRVQDAPVPPKLALSPVSVSFVENKGQANPAAQDVQVSNAGGGTLGVVSAKHHASWLEVTRADKGGRQVLSNAVDLSGLDAGTYGTTVAVQSKGVSGTASYKVSLLVKDLPRVSQITISPATREIGPSGNATFSAQAKDQFGDPIAMVFAWSVSGGGTISPESSSTPQTVHSSTFTSDGGEGTFTVKVASEGVTAEGSVSVATETGQSITILAPNGGEVWPVGSEQLIRFATTNIDDVVIWYSTDAGQHWEPIVPSLDKTKPGWLSYPWQVPNQPSVEALVMIEGYGANEAPTRSERVFEIRASPDSPDTGSPDSRATSADGATMLGSCALSPTFGRFPWLGALLLLLLCVGGVTRRRRRTAPDLAVDRHPRAGSR